MNNRQERLCRAAETGVTCARRLKPNHPRVAAAVQRLQVAVKAARLAGTNQLAARDARAKPQSSVKRAKKLLFQKHLVPIATDGLELLSDMVGLEDVEAQLKLPWLRAPVADHLRAAHRVRAMAGRYEHLYIESRDYDEDFLARFDQAISELHQAATAGNSAARANYSAATQQVRDAVDEVQRCFDSLDARIKETCFGDREALRDWQKHSRIPGKVGRPRKRKGKQKGSEDSRPDDTPKEDA